MRTEDRYIVCKCLSGDSAAFGLLVDKYKASIYALAYSKLRNFHDAEDVTQEAFIKAYQRLRTLRWWDNFLAWLYAITSNLCKEWIRSQSKRSDREFAADQGPGVQKHLSMDSYREGLVRESLQEVLDSLSESYRQVLTLYYFGGMSTKEIARFLGTSPNNVAQRLKRARAKLKKEMITMMGETYEHQRLQEGFTFRIVEMVKRMRMQPVPRVPWLPWGLSVAAGVIIAVLSITSPQVSFSPVNMGSVISDGETVKLPSDRLDMEYSSFTPFGQKVEMLSYANIPVTLEMMPGETQAGQERGQPPQVEQTFLAAAAPAGVPDAEEKVTVSGKVVKDDAPVPNAQVYIYDRDAKTKHEGWTRADGTFRIEISKPDNKKWGNLSVVAQHPQHSFGWAKLSKGNTENVVIKLHAPAAITGMIRNEGGNPIGDGDIRIAAITLHFPGTGARAEDYLSGGAIPVPMLRTGNDGAFAFRSLPEGSGANIDIVAPGYAKERKLNIPAGSEGLILKLGRAGRIEGRVTFGETGEPASAIKVSARPVHPTQGWSDSQTDENGYYILANLPAGEYDVLLTEKYPDWTAAAREHVKITEGQVMKSVDLELVKGGFITGRATYKGIDEPIPGHGISFYDASRPESQASIHSVKTDANGFYRFRAAPGKARVYTSAPGGYQFGHQTKYVHVVEGETVSEVNFQFEKVAQLAMAGRTISADGEPVSGVVITDRRDSFLQHGVSDREGKFTIIGLHPGQKLSVKAEQKALQLRAYADIEVQPGSEAEILMEKYETISVSGRIVDGPGIPIPAASIGLMRWDKDLLLGVGTSAGVANTMGEYTITGLIVGDEYKITANAAGYREGGTEIFTVSQGISRLGDIVLLPPGKFFLQGRVTDTDGEAVVGARVTARSVHSKAKTDENGRYRLDNLPFMVEVTMDVYHHDYGVTTFAYVQTNRTQDFVIAKAERYLAGEVVDADGKPIGGARVSIEPQRDAASGHIVQGTTANLLGEFRLEHILHERESIYVGKGKLYKVLEDVETDRDDVVFVLEEPSEPPKPPSAEQTAKREYWKSTEERRKQLPGKPAPELDVAMWLHGEPVTLAELKGKVVVLYFWEQGARINQIDRIEAIRLLNVLQKEFGEAGLACIGIHESKADVGEQKRIMAERGITFPVALDKKSPVAGARGVTLDKYARPSGPIVIDRTGVVHGRIWDQELEKTIQQLLSE